MNPEQIAEQEAATAAAKEQAEADAKKKADAEAALHTDPIKEALEKEKGKKRPEIERASHSLKSTAERLKELGGDPLKVLGISPNLPAEEADLEDDKPLTVGDFRRMQRNQSQQSALQLAEAIENADERELAKVYLKTRIQSSGDPHQDLADAMALVNSVKNGQVAAEIVRKNAVVTKRHVSGSGNPNEPVPEFQASAEELMAAKIAKVKPANMQKWIEDRREGKTVVFGTAAKKKAEDEAKRR